MSLWIKSFGQGLAMCAEANQLREKKKKNKEKVIIETLVALQTVFKQHYKPDSKHEISESLGFFFYFQKATYSRTYLLFG